MLTVLSDMDRERIRLSSINWGRFQQQKDVMPYLRYWLSERCPLPSCRLRNDVILTADHLWWLWHLPPNGPGCACTVENITERRMRKSGWLQTAEAQLPALALIEPNYDVNWGIVAPEEWPGILVL